MQPPATRRRVAVTFMGIARSTPPIRRSTATRHFGNTSSHPSHSPCRHGPGRVHSDDGDYRGGLGVLTVLQDAPASTYNRRRPCPSPQAHVSAHTTFNRPSAPVGPPPLAGRPIASCGEVRRSPGGAAVVGQQLGPYEILAAHGRRRNGRGLSRPGHASSNRDVAIKVLPDVVAADPRPAGALQREAQMLAALNHPNIAAHLRLRRLGRHARARDGAGRGRRRWPIGSRAGRCRSPRRCRSRGRSPRRSKPRTSRASSIAI